MPGTHMPVVTQPVAVTTSPPKNPSRHHRHPTGTGMGMETGTGTGAVDHHHATIEDDTTAIVTETETGITGEETAVVDHLATVIPTVEATAVITDVTTNVLHRTIGSPSTPTKKRETGWRTVGPNDSLGNLFLMFYPPKNRWPWKNSKRLPLHLTVRIRMYS